MTEKKKKTSKKKSSSKKAEKVEKVEKVENQKVQEGAGLEEVNDAMKKLFNMKLALVSQTPIDSEDVVKVVSQIILCSEKIALLAQRKKAIMTEMGL